MDADTARFLRRVLDGQPVATLATRHRDEPATSMVPFVLDADGSFLIHVSALAPHTADMRTHPRVSLLVMAAVRGDADGVAEGRLCLALGGEPIAVQALPRLSFQADAVFMPADDAALPVARARYLARFPQAAQTFALADFQLVRLNPASARLVAGFGRAHALVGEALRAWLQAPAA